MPEENFVNSGHCEDNVREVAFLGFIQVVMKQFEVYYRILMLWKVILAKVIILEGKVPPASSH